MFIVHQKTLEQSPRDMLQAVNKEGQSLLLAFTGFTSCFRVSAATLSKYLFAGKDIAQKMFFF